MKIVSEKIKLSELKTIAENNYMGLVKAVVDIESEIMAIDADLHADEEKLLLDNGSKQENLWGINIYPSEKDMIEFDSMINIRIWQNNKTRGIDDKKIQTRIINVVNKLIEK